MKGKITIEKDYSQLDKQEQAELFRADNRITSVCQKIEGCATGLKSARVYGVEGQDRETMVMELQGIRRLAGDALKMLGVKVACVAVMLLALAGCGATGRANCDGADKALLMASEREEGINGCKTGQCPAK